MLTGRKAGRHRDAVGAARRDGDPGDPGAEGAAGAQPHLERDLAGRLLPQALQPRAVRAPEPQHGRYARLLRLVGNCSMRPKGLKGACILHGCVHAAAAELMLRYPFDGIRTSLHAWRSSLLTIFGHKQVANSWSAQKGGAKPC